MEGASRRSMGPQAQHTHSMEEGLPRLTLSQNKQISLPQIILTQSRRQITSITTMPPYATPTPSLQLHPHTHHTVTHGFVDRPSWRDRLADGPKAG